MKVNSIPSTIIADRKLHCVAPIILKSNIALESFSITKTKFNAKRKTNLATIEAANTYTITMKFYKSKSLEVLIIHITKLSLF